MNIESLVRENVKKLKPYSSARDEYVSDGTDKVFLDANENPFGQGLNRYPDPQQRAVKDKLAEIRKVSPRQILLGNGSDEVLDLLFRAFCEPGRDRVITLPPTYGMYKVLADINTIEVDEVLLEEGTFQPDLEGIRKACSEHTKMIFLCSPNNPTGTVLEQEKVEAILEMFTGLVVIDEAYIDFSTAGSWVERLEEYPNLVVTQTFSKAWGLAGLRLGTCYASEAVISVLNKIKPPYNINALTQEKALQVLSERETVKEAVECLLEERELLIKALGQCSVVEQTWPSEGNFILARVDDANLRYTQLLDKGIVVRNRNSQPLCQNCLRFTVGTPGENQKLINALESLQNV